jgi:galactokinase
VSAATAVETIRDMFVDVFGRDPEGVWAAPGRVNLIGEHTDYNEGFVLPFALDRRTLAAVAVRRGDRARCVSTELGAAPEVRLGGVSPDTPPPGWSAYPLGVAWALAQLGVDVPGFDLLVTSDVPGGAGVSSSAALQCCVALALSDLAGASLDPSELALAARRAENQIAGAPTGVMDQMVSMRARAGHALFLDCRSLEFRHVTFDPVAHGVTVLVIDTRTRHALAGGLYGSRRQACQEAARIIGVPSLRYATESSVERARNRLGEERYRRAQHVVTENARVLATVAILDAGGDLTSIGPILSASHASLRDTYEVSCPELDAACESAQTAGAIGARMTGGGFGGSAVALVAAELVTRVSAAVTAAAEDRGFPTPAAFAALPADGARRVG